MRSYSQSGQLAHTLPQFRAIARARIRQMRLRLIEHLLHQLHACRDQLLAEAPHPARYPRTLANRYSRPVVRR